MKALLFSSLASLCLSFIIGFIHMWLYTPAYIERELLFRKEYPDRIIFSASSDDLYRWYKCNRPEILRRFKILDVIVQIGGVLFFLIFGVLFYGPYATMFGHSTLSAFLYGTFLILAYLLIFSIERPLTRFLYARTFAKHG
jgi:hypothetical protein